MTSYNLRVSAFPTPLCFMGRRNLNGFPKKRLGVTDKRYPGWDYAGDGGTLICVPWCNLFVSFFRGVINLILVVSGPIKRIPDEQAWMTILHIVDDQSIFEKSLVLDPVVLVDLIWNSLLLVITYAETATIWALLVAWIFSQWLLIQLPQKQLVLAVQFVHLRTQLAGEGS